MLVVKEGALLVRYLAGRLNGAGAAPNGRITRADLLQMKSELLDAMREGQDELHRRITDVSERLARLEGRQ